MEPFAVDLVSAIPQFTTYNGKMQPATVKNKTSNLWSGVTPDQFNEGPTGSRQCATFRLLKSETGQDWGPVQLKVEAHSSVLPTWYKPPDQPPAKFKIMARFDGRADILASDEMEVTSPASGIIRIGRMRVVAPVHEIPFRNAGDWTWVLQRTDITVPEIPAPQKTRLELCFVFAALPPTGPWDFDKTTKVPTRPDFKDSHFIDLFRLFLPSQWEVADNSSSDKSLLAWYANRVVTTVWSFGVTPHKEYPDRPLTKLDVVGGGSFYLSPRPGVPRQYFQPQFGGLFELRRWVLGLYSYCGIFDLAALTQLGCALVQDADGKELLDSKWLTATGNASLGQFYFGYVNSGPLFGWLNLPSCNSPIFGSGGVSDPKSDDDRFPLSWMAWIEVMLPGQSLPTVLDASQGLGSPVQPPNGTKSRADYLTLKVDASWPKPSRLPARTPEMANTDMMLLYSTPDTHLNRLGVLGISNDGL